MKNRLAQLFKDNARPGPAAFRAAVKDDEATIYVYDAIGGWWGGVDAQEFVKELAGIKAGTIHLRINSPGGDVFDARAMQTALRQHKAKVIAHIDGLAASAATFLAMGADEIEMAEGGFWMIHNAWGFTIGNVNDHLEAAAMLEKVDGTIRADYSRKTGKPDDEVRALMDAETWMTAAEAKEAGFVDRVYAAEAPEDKFNLAAYDNAPDPLVGKETDEDKWQALAARLRAATDRRMQLVGEA
jgi:ATP-dependent Clp protease protease subunit